MIFYLERLLQSIWGILAQMNLIANISVSNKGPFPNAKNTVFPNEFVIDYMRVWKLENDPIFKEEENDLVRPEYIENAIISKNSNSLSTAKLKRSVGYIFNKKDFKNHLGYVSAIQESRGQLLIEKNGKFDGLLKVSLFNTSNELKEIELSKYNDT